MMIFNFCVILFERNFARRLFRVIAYNFKDSLSELILKKCGLNLLTLEFVSAGIYSGLKIEDNRNNVMIETNNWDYDWDSPHKIKHKMILKKLELSYNKFGSPESWRLFMRNMIIFCRETIEEIDISNCDLTNS